jgi:hypothetical protein
MPTKSITTAATLNLKQGPGRVYSIFCVSAGTSFTIALKDGPDSAGNTQVKYGTAALQGTTGTYLLNPNQEPVIFRDGVQVVTSGTPGEYLLEYD